MKPEIEIAGPLALDRALVLMLTGVRSTAPSGERAEIDWEIAARTARFAPVRVSLEALCAVAGSYGDRALVVAGGMLFYRRGAGGAVRLLPIADDVFQVGDQTDLRLRIDRVNGDPRSLSLMSIEGVLVTAVRSSPGSDHCSEG